MTMAKCRGCGLGTSDTVAATKMERPGSDGAMVASMPGPMHWQCEVDRLRGLVEEQVSIANGACADVEKIRAERDAYWRGKARELAEKALSKGMKVHRGPPINAHWEGESIDALIAEVYGDE